MGGGRTGAKTYTGLTTGGGCIGGGTGGGTGGGVPFALTPSAIAIRQLLCSFKQNLTATLAASLSFLPIRFTPL